jgi:aerobic carbon-monoxide dehydrogenase large subunit
VRFRITDSAQARALSSVRLVLTAKDPTMSALGPMPCVAIPPNLTIETPPYPVLALDEIFHLGDAVAFVVAKLVSGI